MDAGLGAAARALAIGDVLGALDRVGTREDPPALAMRGVAMARLGELESARRLVKRAAAAFAKRGERLAHARCAVAAAEIDLADRKLARSRGLDEAIGALDRAGDLRNAAWARLVEARRAVALGDLAGALEALAGVRSDAPTIAAVRAIAVCEIALRRLDADAAAEAAGAAKRAATASGIAALEREAGALARALEIPVARVFRGGKTSSARLADVAALERSGAFVVDVCRRRAGGRSLGSRPIPLAILRVLAEAWPAAASRAALIAKVFGVVRANESHRARLRVEIARTRRLAGVRIDASGDGFVLVAEDACVLAPPDDSPAQDALALLSQGGAWPVSSLAAALGKSARSVQRALVALEEAGHASSIGRGRAQRWTRRSEIASHMLLPGLLVAGP
ncbi:MAG TPA: helix-turn-helix domain-containing protein [Polyangiaceae bacterium]|jgi:DNA-binding transcriptional ArsR family regulator